LDAFWWILGGGVLMSAIALIGSVTLLLPEATLSRMIMPLVAFAAGSLLGGAFFHMLPAAMQDTTDPAGVFLVDVRLGIAAWLAAAAHEVPQELGDFGVLVHGGWRKTTALLLNLLSGLTFLAGGLVAYAVSSRIDVGFLVPFAAGNFLYIGASDLVPEVNKHRAARANLLHFGSFVSGIALLWGLRVALES